MRLLLSFVASLVLPAAASAVELAPDCWKAFPATGVSMTAAREASVVRADIDFAGHGGYAILRCTQAIELPPNFELSFKLRGTLPRNTLEVKFIRGEDVWWSVRRDLELPNEPRRISVKKRNVEFAWGPSGPGPLPPKIDAIEIVVSTGTGGKGSIWIDDVALLPMETLAEWPLPRICNVPFEGAGPFTIDLGARRELGGIVIDWTTAPASYSIASSIDGRDWTVVRRVERSSGGRDAIHLPDGDARLLRIDFDRGAIRDVRLLPPLKSDNDFFAAVAADAQPGDYPRYLTGVQTYWTIVGGTAGEQEEMLLGEDGAVEAGDARFTIEPFLLVDGKLVTWNDVAIRHAMDASGRRVEWVKHLTIAPRWENGRFVVKYTVAPGAKLHLAIRPFQVNTPWQFLRRTGGTVRIPKITREPDGSVRVVADREATVLPLTPPTGFGATTYDGGDIVEFLRRGALPDADAVVDPNGYASAAFAFDARTVEITLRSDSEESAAKSVPPVVPFRLELPAEPRIAATIDAQLEYILINRDGPSIQPGSRSYERSWIRDGSLTSTALLQLGHAREVAEFIEWYARAIDPRGYVPCCVSAAGADPVPEHDSHGQFIYLVAEYYRHTRDRELALRMWPVVERVVGFIESLRKQRMTAQYRGTRFYGLVPESISHEGYSAKPMHSYWDDFFILRGLKDAAFLAKELGAKDVGRYERLRDDFRVTLVASIAKTMKESGIDYIPGSAELGDFDATSTTVAISPVDEAASLPASALQRTFDRYLAHAFEPRDYTPYELRIVGTLVRLRRPAEARALLQWLFDDQRPAEWLQWSEGVHRDPREPFFLGDMPHTWVGSDFIRSALDMFAFEERDHLVIAAGISEAWARRGLRVSGLRTHHGVLELSIEPDDDALRMKIGGALHVPPGGLVVVSPIDGRETTIRTLPAELRLTRGEATILPNFRGNP